MNTVANDKMIEISSRIVAIENQIAEKEKELSEVSTVKETPGRLVTTISCLENLRRKLNLFKGIPMQYM